MDNIDETKTTPPEKKTIKSKLEAMSANSSRMLKAIKFDTVTINAYLSIAIKFSLLLLILIAAIAGLSTYKQYSHYGPDCASNTESFQYWANVQTKGKIVSIHQSRIQSENGTTQCYGTFEMEGGKYKDWKGNITELTNGEFIGGVSTK